MNGYTLANHFRKLRISFTFSAVEADLFYELVALCNERNWPTEFQYPNQLLCATLGNLAESTLIRARNRLKQAGLLEFTSGHKRSPTVYRFLDPDAAPIPLHSARENASTSARESASRSESRSASPLTKEKTKRKNTPLSPAAGSEVGEGFPEAASPPSKPPKAARAKKPTAGADEVAALPLPHPGQEFAQLWTTFHTSPQHARKALSAFELMLTKLGKYPEAFAVVMLERAIQGGWSGIENPGTARGYTEWQTEQARQLAPKLDSTSPPAPAIDTAALFGHTQTVAAGLAQARQDPAYQRFLAEQAAHQTDPAPALAA